MTLAIISHTEHYTSDDGVIVGWSPTVNEINHLLDVFDSIIHIAMMYDSKPPKSTMAYDSENITFVPIPAVGGKTLLKKLGILWQSGRIIRIISGVLKQVDYFQMRTPTGIGIFLIPYLSLLNRKAGWFKYAGYWNQGNPPLGYAFQRWMLKRQQRLVTINGKWEDQPEHCISFENPCLTTEDINTGFASMIKKNLEESLTFCFVGRLEREKGVECIYNAFGLLSAEERSRVNVVHFVGNGENLSSYRAKSEHMKINFKFHGSLSRNDIFEIYKQSHVFLLPTTASEGFPKVIAESMNFGCIPIVSDLSSIGQYVKDNVNGFLIDPITPEQLAKKIKYVMELSVNEYDGIKLNQRTLLEKFTFSYYNSRIQNELIK